MQDLSDVFTETDLDTDSLISALREDISQLKQKVLHSQFTTK